MNLSYFHSLHFCASQSIYEGNEYYETFPYTNYGYTEFPFTVSNIYPLYCDKHYSGFQVIYDFIYHILLAIIR